MSELDTSLNELNKEKSQLEEQLKQKCIPVEEESKYYQLEELNHEQTVKFLKSDSTIKAVIKKANSGEMLRKMEIKGADLAHMNKKKLEKWWGIKEDTQRNLILTFIEENNPVVKVFERE